MVMNTGVNLLFIVPNLKYVQVVLQVAHVELLVELCPL